MFSVNFETDDIFCMGGMFTGENLDFLMPYFILSGQKKATADGRQSRLLCK
jgi:hypothetical protein